MKCLHVSLTVHDLSESVQFYSALFGEDRLDAVSLSREPREEPGETVSGCCEPSGSASGCCS